MTSALNSPFVQSYLSLLPTHLHLSPLGVAVVLGWLTEGADVQQLLGEPSCPKSKRLFANSNMLTLKVRAKVLLRIAEQRQQQIIWTVTGVLEQIHARGIGW